MVTRIEGIGVITPEDDLEHCYTEALEAAFEVVGKEAGPVILDLGGCRNVAVQCLLAVSMFSGRLRSEGRPLGVCSSRPAVRSLFLDLRVARNVDVFTDLSAAVKAFRPGARRPLGEILEREFGLARDRLLSALRRQKTHDAPLGQILLVDKAISAVSLALALARQEMNGAA